MSYGINLKIERGFIHLVSVSGDLPEGDFMISGHLDKSSESMALFRRNPDGTFAGQASHSHPVHTAPAVAEGEKHEDEDPF